MLRRLLNIASIVCLVLCVALMGMWVRSYHYQDTLTVGFTATQTFAVGSIPGRVLFDEWSAYAPHERPNWTMDSEPADQSWNMPHPTTGPRRTTGSCHFFRAYSYRLGQGPLGTPHSLLLPYLVPCSRERIAGDGLSNCDGPAVHSSQPVHRDDVPSRRAGNDRVAGPGVDREVKRRRG